MVLGEIPHGEHGTQPVISTGDTFRGLIGGKPVALDILRQVDPVPNICGDIILKMIGQNPTGEEDGTTPMGVDILIPGSKNVTENVVDEQGKMKSDGLPSGTYMLWGRRPSAVDPDKEITHISLVVAGDKNQVIDPLPLGGKPQIQTLEGYLESLFKVEAVMQVPLGPNKNLPTPKV